MPSPYLGAFCSRDHKSLGALAPLGEEMAFLGSKSSAKRQKTSKAVRWKSLEGPSGLPQHLRVLIASSPITLMSLMDLIAELLRR